MKVLNFTRPENGLIEDPLYYLNFEEYENIARDCYLFMADFASEIKTDKYNDKEKIVLTLEEPNGCIWADFDNYCDKILTLCPYTSEGSLKRTTVFFPFHQKYIPKNFDKEFDVAYFGGFPRFFPWAHYIEEINKKYSLKWGNYHSGTNTKCTYNEKIDIYSKSKISIVHGLCDIQHGHQYEYLKVNSQNKAYSHINELVMPQVKSRMFEAAFCKSLILCQKDYWNPIELFFEPNKDFIYFENSEDMMDKIKIILDNYDQYQPIVESAFQKSINNYTVDNFVKKYLM